MSEENVEIVRHYYDVMDSVLERYWTAPDQRLSDSPLLDEVLVLMHPDAEWESTWARSRSRGSDQIMAAVEDWLDASENWRISVEDLIEVGDRVIAVLRISIRGKGSGVPIDQRLWSVTGIRDGKIALIADYTEREPAFEAAARPND